MANMSINVVATELDKVKEIFEVIKSVAADERVPVAVREEIMDKVNIIIESE